jgi:hypothetical protein
VTRGMHSGFAQFPDERARRRFAKTLAQRGGALDRRAHFSDSAPTIVFEDLDDDEFERVRTALRGLGRWVDDVAFDTMQPPERPRS